LCAARPRVRLRAADVCIPETIKLTRAVYEIGAADPIPVKAEHAGKHGGGGGGDIEEGGSCWSINAWWWWDGWAR
jgi:hypothetical protein